MRVSVLAPLLISTFTVPLASEPRYENRNDIYQSEDSDASGAEPGAEPGAAAGKSADAGASADVKRQPGAAVAVASASASTGTGTGTGAGGEPLSDGGGGGGGAARVRKMYETSVTREDESWLSEPVLYAKGEPRTTCPRVCLATWAGPAPCTHAAPCHHAAPLCFILEGVR